MTAPKLAGGPAEIRGLVSVLLAAAVVVVVPGSHSVESAEWLSALVLVLAVALRGYRLARPGPAVLDRLTVALALVPACALFGGASVVVAYDGSDDLSWWGPWLLGYVVAGVLALVAARAWRKD
ncbi:hypothetical protein OHA72_35055 [Dactylosporangium sp. NBC_01737]|uniref:hypothetical protein n=1 Tax=Dactylosporangium sp. NBC_01737 TaxID=2975959 RepID=UPI002E106D78|nr:hypothetical protein OHA72_35055 [Dactylosporangium sp. NBC_01737]